VIGPAQLMIESVVSPTLLPEAAELILIRVLRVFATRADPAHVIVPVHMEIEGTVEACPQPPGFAQQLREVAKPRRNSAEPRPPRRSRINATRTYAQTVTAATCVSRPEHGLSESRPLTTRRRDRCLPSTN
jgi:hypothetical protein